MFMVNKAKQDEKKIGTYKNKTITAILILLMFFRQYQSGIPGVSLGDLLLGLAIILVMFKGRLHVIKVIKEFKFLYILLFLGTIITLISFLIQMNIQTMILTRYIRFFFYMVSIVILVPYFNISFGMKLYRIMCLLTAFYLFVQTMGYNIYGTVLPFKILPIPWFNSDFDTTALADIASKYYYRPSSFFVEPGYIAQFVLPGLALSLYGWKEKEDTNYVDVVIIFCALLLSTSSQAIAIGIIVLVMYSVQKAIMNGRSINFKNVLLFSFVAGLFLIVLKGNYFIRLTIDKISNLKSTTGNFGSGGVRILRGFSVYEKLPTLYKLLGVGHGNIGHFVINNGISTIYDPIDFNLAWADYASGVSSVLNFYGIIGFIIFILFFIDQFRKRGEASQLILLIFLIFTIVSTVFFNIVIVFYITLIYATSRVESGE